MTASPSRNDILVVTALETERNPMARPDRPQYNVRISRVDFDRAGIRTDKINKFKTGNGGALSDIWFYVDSRERVPRGRIELLEERFYSDKMDKHYINYTYQGRAPSVDTTLGSDDDDRAQPTIRVQEEEVVDPARDLRDQWTALAQRLQTPPPASTIPITDPALLQAYTLLGYHMAEAARVFRQLNVM